MIVLKKEGFSQGGSDGVFPRAKVCFLLLGECGPCLDKSCLVSCLSVELLRYSASVLPVHAADLSLSLVCAGSFNTCAVMASNQV